MIWKLNKGIVSAGSWFILNTSDKDAKRALRIIEDGTGSYKGWKIVYKEGNKEITIPFKNARPVNVYPDPIKPVLKKRKKNESK